MIEKTDLNMSEVRKILHDEHNARCRGRSDAEKRVSYDNYRRTKKKVIELERKNLGYLILFPASDKDTNKRKFYNMGGNSAIIYVHELAPRIKRKAVLRRDMDSCNDDEKFHCGICSVLDIDGLETRLAEIGVKRLDMQGELIFFKLAREYSRDEIRNMLKIEQKRLDALNKVLYSNVLYPDIHRQILELKRIIPSKVKNMDKIYREIIGQEAIKSLMILVKYYTQMAHGDINEKNN